MMFKSIKRMATLGLTSILLISNTAYAKESDYYTNKEVYEIKYEGYIQFVPSYTTTSSSYGVAAYRNVKQAYINYSRDGKSVIGGRRYTAPAAYREDGTIYSASASCYDSWNPFAAKTKFNYGWIYFSAR